MDIGTIKRDTAAIEAGQWVGEIPGMGEMRLKVRGMSSALFQREFGRLSRAVPKEQRHRDGAINPEAAAVVMGQALHAAVLIDWDGLSSGGKPLPYDSDLALELLTDPAWRDIADAVVYAAGIVDGARAETAEALEKN